MDLIDELGTVVPELGEMLDIRLNVLKALSKHQLRIGRKALAKQIHLSERTLRTNLQVLRDQSLVDVSRAGIRITDEGQRVGHLIQQLRMGQDRLPEYEAALAKELNIQNCWVVAGDVDSDFTVFQMLAEAVQTILGQELPQEAVVAVTGGSTLANMGQHFTKELSQNRQLSFVPSRGGMEGSFHIQSNTVAGIMAHETQADYVPLYIPDRLTDQLSQEIVKDPTIKKALDLSRSADCLLLSVGAAQVMSKRRKLTPPQERILLEGQAVGEAFGIFYDAEGKVVFSIPRLGLQLEDVIKFPLLLTIVAGQQKAPATRAFYKMMPKQTWLICDKSLAKAVLNGVTQFK
ncbi:sugar-binding transcriptional regulator [Facklamia sp. P12945]|uniref:sugar-binding transcriptional regulator n=1 Tax=unclassified Facklamia TaxID=2622293 RepID=UPI003D18142C